MIRLLTKMTKRREHTKVGCSRHGKPQIDLGQESQGSQQGEVSVGIVFELSVEMSFEV